ncbi:MAG: hypothetical protein AAGA30_19685 [Planctomycetota bacterium]
MRFSPGPKWTTGVNPTTDAMKPMYFRYGSADSMAVIFPAAAYFISDFLATKLNNRAVKID